MLSQRMTLGPLLIAAMIGLVWLDERIGAATQGRGAGAAITVALGLVCAAGAVELAGMLRANGAGVRTWLAVGSAVTALLAWPAAWWLGVPGTSAAAAVCAGALFVSLGETALRRRIDGATVAAGGTLLCAVYLGLLPGFMLGIRHETSGWMLLAVLLIAKSCDIGAYFVGTSVGRRKLIPWLSPGKTWEGLIGGVAVSTLAGVGAAAVSRSEWGAGMGVVLSGWEGAILGGVCGLTGQVGDLAASLFKRDAGLKDASRVLPGFGGVLDVIDSPLLASAAAYGLLRAMG